MKIKFYALLLCLLGLFVPTSVAESCPSPLEIQNIETQRSFVQFRNFTGIDKPIESSGNVVVEQDNILWTVLAPIKITTRITPTGLFQSVMDGPEEPLENSSNGNLNIADTGLLDLLRGDFSTSASNYDMSEIELLENKWSMSLMPKNTELKPYISSIYVTGCKEVLSFEVLQINGDKLTIEFAPE